MVTCKVIFQVEKPWFPVNAELALFYTIPHPIKSHVEGMQLLLFNVFINEVIGGGVVCEDRSFRLRMAHFFEDRVYTTCACHIIENASQFTFCR